MKHKKIELDVDFIGGAKPLTIKEEKELSAYFKKTKHQISFKLYANKKAAMRLLFITA